MHKFFKRPVKYLVILLLLLLVVYLFKGYRNQSAEGSDHLIYFKRDYVLFDDAIKELTKTRDIRYRTNKINIYKRPVNEEIKHDIQKVHLKTMKGKTPMFVHSTREDNMISAYVKDYGTWEEDLLNQTGEFMARHSGITFIDIGCNLGVYTLFIAKLGIKTVSVDPVEQNLNLLSRSLNAGNLAENVTLIFNALSDIYMTVSINIPKDNIGGAHIVSDIKHDTKFSLINTETILLDDIIPYIKSDKVFIKMDVEGHEWNVLKGGHDIFQMKDVKGILMEWVHHRGQQNGKLIVDRLMKNGFLPFEDILMKHILDPESYYMWPENVFWIKR